MSKVVKDIFERLSSSISVPMDDPQYPNIRDAVNQTIKRSVRLNSATDIDQVHECLSEIIGNPVDESTTIFPPFYTNFGRHITLSKDIFINHACSFLDLGGIVIGDGVMIGLRVNITSESHPIDVPNRKTLVPMSVVIKQNAWIGAGASILTGVTIGENAIVAAGGIGYQRCTCQYACWWCAS